jgi:hypothetical protein
MGDHRSPDNRATQINQVNMSDRGCKRPEAIYNPVGKKTPQPYLIIIPVLI